MYCISQYVGLFCRSLLQVSFDVYRSLLHVNVCICISQYEMRTVCGGGYLCSAPTCAALMIELCVSEY